MKGNHIHINSIDVNVSSGDSLFNAIPEAIILAFTENVSVVL